MTHQDQAYDLICRRVDLFHRHISEYKSEARQNETETRIKFIDHFFKALGWDMDNSKCLPPHLEEVIREETIGIEDYDTPSTDTTRPTQRRTDYTFRDSKGKPLFYLEAKKPSVDILHGNNEALQIRSYSWNTNLPIGVLTDFEELAVYDGTIPTTPADNAARARADYFKYTQYSDRTTFDYIYQRFAQPNVTRAALQRYQQTYTDQFNSRKGSITVDEKFLQSLEEWRTELAQHVVTHNDKAVFSLDEINYFVQITINRILFLRNCEDRNIEPYRALQTCIENTDAPNAAYANFLRLCERANQRYNSGLFDLQRYNRLAYRMLIANKVLGNIISNTYYPVSPYRFELISPDILGTAYERFLGKTITIANKTNAKGQTLGTTNSEGIFIPSKVATVEYKPEVRKAGGVFYTPQYIVQYIVENTIGKLIANKTPEQVAQITCCDPACGSGSFLIGAYQYLIDWHTQYYTNNPKAAKAQPNRPAPLQHGRLTVAERKRILTNNIYGVDIDAQAVEVTKLSLLMLCLADSESPTQGSQHILPNIDSNIKCGNSLIDTSFDWKTEFNAVFEHGGFDAVIGNPPYVRQELWSNDYKPYFAKNYQTYHGLADLYVFFIEKSLSILKKDGLYSIIVGNKWMRAGYGEPLRKFLLEKQILEITDFGDLPVFKGVAAYPCILTVKNNAPITPQDQNAAPPIIPQKIKALYEAFETARTSGYLPEGIQESLEISANDIQQLFKKIKEMQAYKNQLNGLFNTLQEILNEINAERTRIVQHIGLRMTLIKTLNFDNLSNYVHENAVPWHQNKLGASEWVITDDLKNNLLDNLKNKGTELKKYINGESYRGIITGLSEAFIIDKAQKNNIETRTEYPTILKPYCAGRDVQQYTQPKTDKFLILLPKGFTNKIGDNPSEPFDWLTQHFQPIANHLKPFEAAAQKRYDKGDYWWELRACDYYPLFNQPKIMYQVFQVKPCFTLDTQGYFCNNSVWFIPSDEKYLLGLLNSKLGWYLITQYCSQIQGGYQLIWKYLSKIPIYKIDFSKIVEKEIYGKITDLVTKILAAKSNNQNTAHLEAEIDTLVYQLYNLTPAEIAIIEST